MLNCYDVDLSTDSTPRVPRSGIFFLFFWQHLTTGEYYSAIFQLGGSRLFCHGLPSLSPSFTPVCILHNSPSHWLTKRAPKPKKYHDFFFDPNIMTSTTTNKRRPTLKSSQWSDYSVPSVAAMWCLKFKCLKKRY